MKTKHCQWCDNTFETSISYQIYCSPGCRDGATKEKIAQRYALTRRSKRLGKDRKCKSCGAKLSIYNDDTLCSICHVNPTDVNKALKEIRGMANGKDWTD
jgi:5-methylcytosine-specific restriction endonuclease McrA